MYNAQQILERKGFDLDQINDIINFKTKHSEEGFDVKVREEFKVGDEPLHLLESYYIGDADEEIILTIANDQGYKSSSELLKVMSERLNELCNELTFIDALTDRDINSCVLVECKDFEDFQENAEFGQKWEDKKSELIHYKFKDVENDLAISVHIKDGEIIED